MAEEPRILLIVSDFHLSEGWDDDEERWHRLEDFRFDAAFSRFLRKQARIAGEKGHRLRLIMGGDLVDFLQVKTIPSQKSFLGDDFHLQDRLFSFGTSPRLRYQRLGLGTSQDQTIWKLQRIITGHPVFFHALANFLAEGHDLVILPGNHDIEWIIPAVQAVFIKSVADLSPVDSRGGVASRIRFQPWFYLEPDLIYIEHGNQYDAVDAFDYFLYPHLKDGRIILPAGSFFVRYLFNHVEFCWPFADNMKPPSAFIWWALKRWEAWRNLPKYIRFFLETLDKAGPIPLEWRDELEQKHANRLRHQANHTGLSLDVLGKLKALWAPSALHHLSKLRLAFAFLGRAARNAPLREIAHNINQILGVRYTVFGHTHEAVRELLAAGTPRAEYVNSGTWTKVFASRSEKRRQKEESEFVYVQVDRAEQKIELLRWRDELGEGEHVRLFKQPKEGRKGRAMLGSKEFTILFLMGALLASVGDWFHVHTETTSYPPEVYGWYVKSIPFFIPLIFGLAAAFFGMVYEQAKKFLGAGYFRERAALSHIFGAGLVYMVLHALSGYIAHWRFPLPDLILALPAVLTWCLLDRSLGGFLVCLSAGLIGVSAEILLVHKGIFSFSEKADAFFGVATWLPWIYMMGALAIGRFIERRRAYEI